MFLALVTWNKLDAREHCNAMARERPLVTPVGNARPDFLLCVHEGHAVALGHCYAPVTGARVPSRCTPTSA